jgi:stringent starvation protein B
MNEPTTTSTQVPREFVNEGEIVLNVSYDATGSLQLGNEFIEFKARFGGSLSIYLTSFQNAAFNLQAIRMKMPRKIKTPTPTRMRVFWAGSPIHCRKFTKSPTA